MQQSTWKILPFLFLLSGCKDRQTEGSQLVVRVEQASLRAEPRENSRELAALLKGQTLTDLGEVGPSESQIAVGCDVFQTPWIKVQTSENQIGWIREWDVRQVKETKDWLLQKRMLCYFGNALASRRNVLQKKFVQTETDLQVAEAWQESSTLRDTFLQLLSRRPEREFQVQFNWLGEVLPGFLFQKIGEGEGPCLFANFHDWLQKALKTNGLQDDAFFQACLTAFPQDSIESFFPAWKFQLSESESVSQLGAGQHLKMLRQIDRGLEAGLLFAASLELLKDQVLEDIFGKNMRYWQSPEKILGELGQILSEPPKCLNAREQESLRIRQKMFEDPIANGVVVNLRSGE